MDETFAEAIIQRAAPWHARRRGLSGHKVLGRYLRPFAYWHVFLLDAIESPFAGHLAPFDFGALVLAVDYCRAVYPHRPFHTRGARFRHTATVWRYARHFWREMDAFHAYRADYFAPPPLLTSGEAGEPIKTPWYLYSVARLLHETSMTLKEAWMTPVCAGQWYNIALLEAAGHSPKLMTPALRKVLQSLGHQV